MDADLLSRLTTLYRDLHQHPELSSQEHRTAGIVAQWLTDLGLEVIEGIGGTGVVGILRNGPGGTVLMRADLDAPRALAAVDEWAATGGEDRHGPAAVRRAVDALLGVAL